MPGADMTIPLLQLHSPHRRFAQALARIRKSQRVQLLAIEVDETQAPAPGDKGLR